MFPFGPVVDPRYPARSGWRDDRAYRGGWHEGLDFATPIGAPVFAGAGGKVLIADESAGVEGKWIVLEHPWGVSRYMHNERLLVKRGQSVVVVQPIALSGSSGIARSAAHLHFDLAIREELLPRYVKAYGTPKGGFGKRRVYGGHAVVSVPCEPIVPASLADRVLVAAKDRGVALRSGTWDSIGIGVLAELATKGGIV